MAFVDPKLTLKELIAVQRKMYKKFVPVQCYMLRKEIKFTAQGFEHLHMDGRKHRRGEKSARARLLLLEYAPSVISQARFMKKDVKDPQESYSGKLEVYHELYGKVGIKQIGVVLTIRTIGDGEPHFYGIRYKWKKTT